MPGPLHRTTASSAPLPKFGPEIEPNDQIQVIHPTDCLCPACEYDRKHQTLREAAIRVGESLKRLEEATRKLVQAAKDDDDAS